MRGGAAGGGGDAGTRAVRGGAAGGGGDAEGDAKVRGFAAPAAGAGCTRTALSTAGRIAVFGSTKRTKAAVNRVPVDAAPTIPITVRKRRFLASNPRDRRRGAPPGGNRPLAAGSPSEDRRIRSAISR